MKTRQISANSEEMEKFDLFLHSVQGSVLFTASLFGFDAAVILQCLALLTATIAVSLTKQINDEETVPSDAETVRSRAKAITNIALTGDPNNSGIFAETNKVN